MKPDQVDRAVRFARGTSVLVHGTVTIGILFQFFGLPALFAGHPTLCWLAIGGGILSCVGLTILAREKGRCWAWGLLGFLNFPGAWFVFRRLQSRDLS